MGKVFIRDWMSRKAVAERDHIPMESLDISSNFLLSVSVEGNGTSRIPFMLRIFSV